MLLYLFLSSTGPSSQVEVGPEKVVFDRVVLFAAGDPTEQTVSVTIPNDLIALENDELVNVNLTIICPASGVTFGQFSTTLVTIVDDDRKFAKYNKCCFIFECNKICICLVCLALNAYFTKPNVTVSEDDKMVRICVEKSLETISDVVFSLESCNGTATGKRSTLTTCNTPNYKSLLLSFSRSS